ncbi:UDP-4-amino-4,6-dideoxy-N-acetyl-beta-L-altrosamine N-acetyltransferase [Haliea sp. E1-2-M8]|uniref:UDP-4-amino-4, 6-dideoxy-N-acetyl-beta-L-altrosamine N-acetyltransferase n=1 Tax=Haliea sp. E1-2-M8 TaxID=3064706 RepID=UPI002722ECA8|nr:UDP-4-amino-4,6-dideoxy-N-acetyl-beta-L-altrosamine N-acetyltransferase [Haliea sp. E1-2-M8]MDO8861655.1 UDP-4-amino-4,6-dideoxy-N-acetyl-beta-L-altrosamine N-acetyltransferase [Haliea sp. E1-2-M8]
MSQADLEQVLVWRNHADVRRYMYTTHEIGLDEHRKWFGSAKSNPDTHLLIFERDGQASGFVNISSTRCLEVADWGFYVAPDAPKGTGRALGKRVLTYAFGELGLHKVCGQALGFNERSIQFHTVLGFTEEGRLRDQHFDGHKYHDVVCFGLLANEWEATVEVIVE